MEYDVFSNVILYLTYSLDNRVLEQFVVAVVYDDISTNSDAAASSRENENILKCLISLALKGTVV